MSGFDEHVQQYLSLRRSFGFKLEREEHLLAQFVAYSDAAGQEHLTGDLAIAWAKLPVTASVNQWAKRLSVIRSFAVYLATMDAATEVPPSGIFPTSRQRPTPYLFSEPDIERVLTAARGLGSPLRAATYETLFGLLAVSGMRIGEALGLTRGDVDLGSGVITIRHAKFDRTRLVPLHESTTAALSAYALTRDRLRRPPRADVFFCSTAGTALGRSGVDRMFRKITTTLGLRTGTTHPRVHDLRHGFAVRTIVNWQEQGVSIDAHLASLSGYLGHVAPADTYWYLSAVPELMTLAADRLQVRFGAQR
ncbi:tyrosine-type recombinase/integrase [Agromyces bauzanensis]|uniref:Integrase n=1 Tax=Agromyces bauzanensis TaxID=1308924 RepID=A0A917PWJ7_9MICO|nr:tyrosine-type recombinase/integrase [Agromyces bauzanensis]GGJ95018.1 integrase [Agromyces bauzanensis]